MPVAALAAGRHFSFTSLDRYDRYKNDENDNRYQYSGGNG